MIISDIVSSLMTSVVPDTLIDLLLYHYTEDMLSTKLLRPPLNVLPGRRLPLAPTVIFIMNCYFPVNVISFHIL